MSVEIDDVQAYMKRLGQQAREAATVTARAEASAKNHALQATADILDASRAELVQANRKDLENGKANGFK